jgi:hypothetical protein
MTAFAHIFSDAIGLIEDNIYVKNGYYVLKIPILIIH